jgi:hypothetical protein
VILATHLLHEINRLTRVHMLSWLSSIFNQLWLIPSVQSINARLEAKSLRISLSKTEEIWRCDGILKRNVVL